MLARVNRLSWSVVARALSGKRRVALGCALVAIFSTLTFARVLGFDFVFDDHWTIERNERLAGPLLPVLSAVLRGTARAAHITDATRPSMIVSTWIDRHLFGLSPAGFHAHSLLAYAGTTVLAALILLALFGRPLPALVGGIFFGLAPVHAEAVASINYREDLLAAIGVMAPLSSLLARRKRPESFGEALAMAMTWGLGLLAKESATALLPLLVLVALTRPSPRSWLVARERTLVCLEAVFILWINWRLALALGGDDIPRARYAGPAARIAAFARFEVRALTSSVFPFTWSPEHAREATASPLWIVLLAAIGAGVTLALRRESVRRPAFGLAFALLAAIPSSPLTGPINETADRYYFLSVLGGGIFWGAIADAVARKVQKVPRSLLVPALVAMAAPLLVVSQLAARPWANDGILWSTAVEKAPRSARAWTGLSRVYRLAGDLAAADQALARAFELDPGYAPARVTQIYNSLARGDVEAARRAIQEARLDAGSTPGLRKAISCASYPSEEARACIMSASR
jgi:hypothetical protein